MLPPDLPIDGRMLDVSTDGAALLINRSLPIDTTLTLMIAVPAPDNLSEMRPFQSQARVIYSIMTQDGCRIGLQFISPSQASLAVIEPWIRRYIEMGRLSN